jgi:hypothetical protein
LLISFSGVTLLSLSRQVIPGTLQRHRAEAEKLLMTGVLPLWRSPWFNVFSLAFTGLLCDDVCGNWPGFGPALIKIVRKHWPRTSPVKQVSFAQVLMALAPLLAPPDLPRQLPIVMGFVVKLVTGPNLLALRFILPRLETPEWRRLIAATGAGMRRELGEAIADIAARHWDTQMREVAGRLNEKNAAESKGDGKRRNGAEASGANVHPALIADRCEQGWRFVVDEAIELCPEVDEIAFMKRVGELLIMPNEKVEWGIGSKLKGKARSPMSRSMMFGR